MYKWWFSASNNSGLRLSEEGYEFLTQKLDLRAYQINFEDTLHASPSTMVFLAQYMDCPYLLRNNQIIVFSERKSIELYLFSGDIRRLGIVKAINKQRKLSNTNTKGV